MSQTPPDIAKWLKQADVAIEGASETQDWSAVHDILKLKAMAIGLLWDGHSPLPPESESK